MADHPLNFRVRIGQPTSATLDSPRIGEAQVGRIIIDEPGFEPTSVPSVPDAIGIGKPFAQQDEEPLVTIPQPESKPETQTPGLLDQILHLFS